MIIDDQINAMLAYTPTIQDIREMLEEITKEIDGSDLKYLIENQTTDESYYAIVYEDEEDRTYFVRIHYFRNEDVHEFWTLYYTDNPVKFIQNKIGSHLGWVVKHEESF